MTLKQQRSQTVQNYIEFLSDFYKTYTPKANILSSFYPKQLKKNIDKRKNQNSARIVHGLRAPTKPAACKKALEQMRMLSRCQSSSIQIALQKIDRRSKPIKKNEKLISQSLKRKEILLD
jgi:hypothetical protein